MSLPLPLLSLYYNFDIAEQASFGIGGRIYSWLVVSVISPSAYFEFRPVEKIALKGSLAYGGLILATLMGLPMPIISPEISVSYKISERLRIQAGCSGLFYANGFEIDKTFFIVPFAGIAWSLTKPR
jgi:hypothetical protein